MGNRMALGGLLRFHKYHEAQAIISQGKRMCANQHIYRISESRVEPYFRVKSRTLLVPQRLNRVHLRGAPGREVAEHHPDTR